MAGKKIESPYLFVDNPKKLGALKLHVFRNWTEHEHENWWESLECNICLAVKEWKSHVR